jgi:hypothetical protein
MTDGLISITKMVIDQGNTIEKLSRRFPMLDGPDIDWVTAEKIHVMYKALYTNGQTLEHIAERGGFGWGEVRLMAEKVKK